ncbi:nicotinate-nucleotide pyrophosphorylase [Mycobacterium xenopi 4042]|uniref:Nicotinate-nucleotide pyrophosphorylase n=1 Tax=Mycobacterium xenopi 4042 TaxID=1299334 RepID=X7YNM7_MYCXE|nr:nicotinate-nucleotide pyrophosphorylase [Mycobacterium xenopi 4042]
MNHRLGLGDAALIKDNHVAAAGSVVAALRAVRAATPDLPCEVEVDSLEQLDEVLAEKPELVLLDNFAVWQTQIAVQRRDARAAGTKLESSGVCRWTMPRNTPPPGSTSLRWVRSPTRRGCSTSAWTREPASTEQTQKRPNRLNISRLRICSRIAIA